VLWVSFRGGVSSVKRASMREPFPCGIFFMRAVEFAETWSSSEWRAKEFPE